MLCQTRASFRGSKHLPQSLRHGPLTKASFATSSGRHKDSFVRNLLNPWAAVLRSGGPRLPESEAMHRAESFMNTCVVVGTLQSAIAAAGIATVPNVDDDTGPLTEWGLLPSDPQRRRRLYLSLLSGSLYTNLIGIGLASTVSLWMSAGVPHGMSRMFLINMSWLLSGSTALLAVGSGMLGVGIAVGLDGSSPTNKTNGAGDDGTTFVGVPHPGSVATAGAVIGGFSVAGAHLAGAYAARATGRMVTYGRATLPAGRRCHRRKRRRGDFAR